MDIIKSLSRAQARSFYAYLDTDECFGFTQSLCQALAMGDTARAGWITNSMGNSIKAKVGVSFFTALGLIDWILEQ